MKNGIIRMIALVLSLTFAITLFVSCGNIIESTTAQNQTTESTTEKSDDPIVPSVTIESLMKKYDCITLQKAIELSPDNKDVETEEKYYVCGKITEITNTKYGQMIITDGKDSYEIYGVYLEDGTAYDGMANKPVAGDLIVVYGKLGFYKAPEMKKAVLIEYYHEAPTVDEKDYKELSIKEAREVKDDTKVKVTGVVVQLTYANGMAPNGFFVTDGTESIYVYGNAAATVKVGNKVTVAGNRIHYISETEIDAAAKWGYQGCCQIADPIVVENDGKTNEADLSWVKTLSIKDIVNNDITTNVTTTIYKTVALIKKAPGVGYINYYIDDLDGHTGSYCYSSNNGSDFSYLDEYDGKIVELYVSPINAKSAAAGCNYRFVPIEIISVGYTLDAKDAPAFIYNYYVKDEISLTYDAVSSITLPTTADAEVLDIKGATISYASSDTSVISFDNGTMSIKKNGTVKVTVTVTVNGQSQNFDIDVTVNVKNEVSSITVKEAIDTADEVEIVVKGVVASGIANQVGFYLIDETGVIAVKCSADELAKVKIGELVVVKGTKTHFKKADAYAGQSCILDSTIENNLHGNYEYSTDSFLGNMSVEEMVACDVLKDYTSEVHVITATLKKGDKAWTIISEDGSSYVTLYAGSVDQYSWLNDFDGKTVKMDFALCNWNAKKPYKGCVLAVYTDAGKIVNPGKLG